MSDVGRALEESLGVINLKTMRARLFPYHQAIHKLDNKNKPTEHQFVPEMFADVIVTLATQTTAAEDKTRRNSWMRPPGSRSPFHPE